MFPRPGLWQNDEGTLETDPNGWMGGIQILDTSASGIVLEENGAGGLTLFDAGGGGLIFNTVGHVFVTIPTADPHVSGALFSLAGVVHISAG
jgi:hypothetical protein